MYIFLVWSISAMRSMGDLGSVVFQMDYEDTDQPGHMHRLT